MPVGGLARVQPPSSAHDLVVPSASKSDDDLEEFLADLSFRADVVESANVSPRKMDPSKLQAHRARQR
jgi:hypothetical protein